MPNIAGQLWMVFTGANVNIIAAAEDTPILYEQQSRNFGYFVVFTHFLKYEAYNVPNLRPPPTFIQFDAVPLELSFAYGEDAIRRVPTDAGYAEILQPPYGSPPWGFAIGFLGNVTF